MPQTAPFLRQVFAVPASFPQDVGYPFDLPWVRGLDLTFTSPVAFLVGENGSGKSTLLEAIADKARLPVSGGSRQELQQNTGPDSESPLAQGIRARWGMKPRDGYFLRAEFHAHFASLLEARKNDPDFLGNPYDVYGGRSLFTQSHGEAFLAIMQNRFEEGFFLLDEPESALSPQRQLALLSLIDSLVQEGGSQFIIATHSPILMTFPGAQIHCFEDGVLKELPLEETQHFQITRRILNDRESYWRYLRE
ncbi:MAG: AAA family ATPase [Acidobacteriaceae bacterium]|nr:AAA family ATPase [Acidobacteriaceae bacterium]